MADIRLAKPAAGASESVQCAPDARFVFDFPTTDATLAREGDNLNISFQDGSQLQLQGFYQEYNGENLPSFNIDGTEVAAADFFQAMNEPDLMPAAGPGTGTVANGARFHEWGDSALTGGLLHLDGLDWGFSRSFEWEDHPNAVGYDDDGWRGAANTVPDLDVPVAPERPYDPRNPGDDPNNPASPQNPGGYIPNTHGASIVVDEGALAKGSGQHVLHGVHDYGSFVADVHAERGGSIELSFGGKVVTLEIPRDGSLRIAPSGDASFANVNGVDIRILGAQSTGDGKWVVRYEYRLGDHIDHDKLLGQDTVRYDGEGIAITVTDGSGDVTRGRITVEVHDDVPLLRVLSAPAVIRDSVDKVTAKIDGLSFGADDEDAKTLTINVKSDDLPDEQGVTYTYAIEALPGGGYTFTSDEEGAPTLQLEGDGSYTLTYTRPEGHAEDDGVVDASANTYTFTVTVTDSDGDAVGRDVTVTTKPAPFIIVGPDPKPDPDPDNPDNPEDPKLKVADPDTAASTVVTDDSNQEGGTSYGKDASDGGYGGTSPSASSSFGLLLNGLDYTLTITGKDEDGGSKTLTIELNADGSFKSFSVNGEASSTDAGSLADVTLYGGYGEISGIGITPPQAGGNQSKVSYTYTQTQPFSHKHDDPADPENTSDESMDAEIFGITLNDGLHDKVESFIQVKIEDDEPEAGVLAVKDQRPKKPETADDDANAGGGEGTGDDTPHAAIADSASTITALLKDMTFGADNGDDKTLTITVVKEVAGGKPTSLNYEYTIAQQGDHYTFTHSKPSEGNPEGGNAPTLVYDPTSGGYKLTYSRDEAEVDKGNEFGAESDTYTFKVTVTDDDGDTDACSVVVSTIPEPLIIQGPDPDPEPDPSEDPDPNPDPVVADMKTAAGWVVTDDSYLEGGNPGQQNLEDDGLSSSDSANSSFNLKLNGLDYTLTIKGKDSDGADALEKTLTIKLTAEGEVESFSVSVDGETFETPGKTLAEVELYGAYGKISVTDVQPDGGNQSTVSYTYTQTKPYSHTPGEGEINLPDELHELADRFDITLDDHMHDPKSSFIRVDIEDDAPEAGVLTVTNATPAATPGETTPNAGDEGAAGSEGAFPAEGTVPPPAEIKDSDGEITALLKGMTFGADNGKDKALTITVAKEVAGGEETSRNYEYTIAQEDDHYTFTRSASEQEGGNAPSLVYDSASGGYKLTYTRNNNNNEVQNDQNATSDTYTFTVTVKDADGDVDDCSVTVTTRPGVFIIPGKDPETDDEGNKIDGVASWVTTDDSYLTTGTKQPPKAAQGDADAAQPLAEVESAGDSTASSAADGLSDADFAHSNFSLQLNGLKCVLTIKGASVDGKDNANTLEIVLNEAGKLESYTYTDKDGGAHPGYTENELAAVELDGVYGNISAITLRDGTSERTDIPTVQVSYKYTQTDPYSHKHDDPNDPGEPDELSPASPPAEEFALTLDDGLHAPVSSSIKVDIEDDEPVAGNLSITNAGSIVGQPDAEGVPHAEIKDSEDTITASLEGLTFGADNGEGKSVTITVEHAIKGAAENAGAEGADAATSAGTGDGGTTATLPPYTYTATPNEDGKGYTFTCTQDGAPTLSYNEDGSYTLTYKRPDGDVEQANQTGATGDEYTFTVTVKDADGDVDQCSVTVSTTPQQLIIPDTDPHKPASEKLAASTVVTDDSYVEGGIYFDNPESDGGDGTSYYKSSSFGLQLNGRQCTLTITGKTELGGVTDSTLTIVFKEDGTIKSCEVDGETANLNDVELFGSYGKISGISVSVDGSKVSYTYTQEKAYTHTHEPDEPSYTTPDEKAEKADSFALSLSDGMHETVKSFIQVDIEDDAPALSLTTRSLGEILAGTTSKEADLFSSYTFGADNAAGKKLTVTALDVENAQAQSLLDASGNFAGVEVRGRYGTLTIDAQGKYTYTANKNAQGEDKFQFTITDSDNDVVTTDADGNSNTLVVKVYEPTPPVIGPVTVNEHGLMSAEDTSETAGVTIPAGWTVVGVGKATNGVVERKGEDGQNVEYTLSRRLDHESGAEYNTALEADSFTVTLKDAHGNTYTVPVTVNVVDDVDGLRNLDTGDVHVDRVATNTVLDFVHEGDPHYLPEALQPSKAIILSNGFRVIATTVTYKEGYLLDNGGWKGEGNLSGTDYAGQKVLNVSGNGLSVGKLSDEDPKDLSFGGRDQVGVRPDNHAVSEGIVIECQNGGVQYGMDIDFGKFDDNDRVLMTFYMTPQNSNDDNLVLSRVVTHDQLQDGTLHVDVTDGFTKVIVSALPDAKNKVTDTHGFTIEKITTTRYAEVYEGSVELVPGADSYGKIANVSWALAGELEDALTGNGVEVLGTVGAGRYGVELTPNGKTITAKLVGFDDEQYGELNLKDMVLFEATLKDDGSWTVKQFYNFTLYGQIASPALNFVFSVTDMDQDVTTLPLTVQLNNDSLHDRFDNVVVGYHNPAWGDQAAYDRAADVLAGGSGNDLMYSRGGNDVMIGDGGEDAINSLANKLGVTPRDDYTLDEVKFLQAGDNADFVNDIYGNLKAYAENAKNPQKNQALENLIATLETLEEKDGGDDAMYGGLGNDVLLGGAGNDYLVGSGKDVDPDYIYKMDQNGDYVLGEDGKKIILYKGQQALRDYSEDHDIILGGSGNDIILYDDDSDLAYKGSDSGYETNPDYTGDVLVHGGSGIDVLLVGNQTKQSLADIQSNQNKMKTVVRGMEVLLRSNNTPHVESLGITSHESLARYGIRIEADSVLLTAAWGEAQQKAGYTEYTYKNTTDGMDLTLQIIDGTEVQTIGVRGDSFLLGSGAHDTLTGTNEADILYAGAGHDRLDGGKDNDILFGDDINFEGGVTYTDISASDIRANLQEYAEASAHSGEGNDVLKGGEGDDILFGGGGDDRLEGGTGNDLLFGGDGEDTLFGGSGNDYLHGGDGRDWLYGEAGDDLIVYDPTDYLIDGGDGIDFLLAGLDSNPGQPLSLGTLLTEGDGNGTPIVRDVEVLLKGDGITSLTSLDQLEKRFDIKMEDGKLRLGDEWQHEGAKTFHQGDADEVTVHTWTNKNYEGVTLETTLTSSTETDGNLLQATAELQNLS